MADPRDDDPPQYTLYRARPRFLSRRGDDGALGGRRRERAPVGYEAPKRRRRISVKRVIGLLFAALAAWLLVSLILFMISAQLESAKVSDRADAELGGGGYTLTSPNTVLVLGSDARLKGTHEKGANVIGQPSRSDSILLMRIGGGHNATLAIPRDTVVDIPGHGRNKINAAYAFGGPALAVETVQSYLHLEVDHVVEVSFDNFPQLIDAMGGITYKGGCVVSKINGGFKNGGFTPRPKRGKTHIDGKQALALARTRHNLCNARENDLTRARRQQKIFSAMKRRMISPFTFVRLPWVAWAAPKAIHSDMGGPSLLGLFTGMGVSGSPGPRVLKPDGNITLPDGGSGLHVSDAEVRREVQAFMSA